MPTEKRIGEFFPDIQGDEVSRPRRKAAEKATARMQSEEFDDMGDQEEYDDDRDDDWESGKADEEDEEMDTQERDVDEMFGDMDEDSDYEPDSKKAKKTDAFWIGKRRAGRPSSKMGVSQVSVPSSSDTEGGSDSQKSKPSVPVASLTTKETVRPSVSETPRPTPITYTPRSKASGVILQPDSNGNYVCPHCTNPKYETPQVTLYTQHLVKHGLPSWKCGHCTIRLQNREELQRHINVRHPGEKPIMIQVDFQDRERVIRPISTQVTASTTAPTVPPAKSIDSAPNKAATTAAASPSVSTESDSSTASTTSAKPSAPVSKTEAELKLNCPYCSYQTTNLNDYEQHLAKHKKSGGSSGVQPSKQTAKNQDSQETKKKSDTTKKTDTTAGKSGYKCGHCEVVWELKKDLLIHIYKDHPKCPILYSEVDTEPKRPQLITKPGQVTATSKETNLPKSSTSSIESSPVKQTARKRTHKAHKQLDRTEQVSTVVAKPRVGNIAVKPCKVLVMDFFLQSEEKIERITKQYSVSNINM